MLALSLAYQMTDLLNIKVGYRTLDADYNTQGFVLDARTEGLALALGLNFWQSNL